MYKRKYVPYRSYVASLTQSETDAPEATVFENNLGAKLKAETIVWTRTGAGVYVGTLAGKFKVGKTVVFISNPILADGSSVQVQRATDNTIQIKTGTNTVTVEEDGEAYEASVVNTPTDDILGSIPHVIEIRIYD